MNTQPSIEATVNADGTASITINGDTTDLDTTSVEQARSTTLAMVTAHAHTIGASVRAVMHDAQGSWPVTVHPDGRIEPHTEPHTATHTGTSAPSGSRAQTRVAEARTLATSLEENSASPQPAKNSDPIAPVQTEHGTKDAAENADEKTAPETPGETLTGAHLPVDPDDEPVTLPTETNAPDPMVGSSATDAAQSHEARQSFLIHEHTKKPAEHGWRGALSRLGLHLEPSEAERTEREDEQAVSQHWPGPRTIAVVNGKGGVGKTPTTVVLSAVFARYGGAGVLAWDNNQTRGTLGWRTEQGPHEATMLDLLPETNRLLSTDAQSADLAHYVHHQARDKFDVLRSKPMALAQEQRVSPQDVDAVHAVAAKYYRLIFMDSGNDESDPMWLRMIDHADQLVVATTTRKDHAEAGALLLEALAERNEYCAALARNAVAVITRADPRATDAEMERIAEGYRSLVRAVVRIPHDPALVDGQISYEALHPVSRRAWLSAAAAVASGLGAF